MTHFDIESAYCDITRQTGEFLESLGSPQVVIGLSGGIDSSVVASLAVSILGSSAVHGVLMPGPYSSTSSISDALDLAQALNIRTSTFSITPAYDVFAASYQDSFGASLQGSASENTQARLRMCVLMALSNEHGWVVLNTGNASEAAMGYSTLYGDTCGVYAPIGGLYKTEVYELANYLNYRATQEGKKPPIPQNVIVKAPSAELSENQYDEEALGLRYEELDALLVRMIDNNERPEDISQEAIQIWERYCANAFKRSLEPPFPHIARC